MRFHNLVQNGEYPNCTTLASEFEVSASGPSCGTWIS